MIPPRETALKRARQYLHSAVRHAKHASLWTRHRVASAIRKLRQLAASLRRIPLHKLALKLTHPKMPAWQRCPSLVFPAWTKKRVNQWHPSERSFPREKDWTTETYVAEFDKLNRLVHIPHVSVI